MAGHPKTIRKAAALLKDMTVNEVLGHVGAVIGTARQPDYVRVGPCIAAVAHLDLTRLRHVQRLQSYGHGAVMPSPADAEVDRTSNEDLNQVMQGLERVEISKVLPDSFGNQVWRRVGGSKVGS